MHAQFLYDMLATTSLYVQLGEKAVHSATANPKHGKTCDMVNL